MRKENLLVWDDHHEKLIQIKAEEYSIDKRLVICQARNYYILYDKQTGIPYCYWQESLSLLEKHYKSNLKEYNKIVGSKKYLRWQEEYEKEKEKEK